MPTIAPHSMPIGTEAPNFELTDVVSGNKVTLDDYAKGRGTLIMFICRHCPYVVHVREALIELANEYLPKEIAFVAISSNDAVKYPDDAPDRLREMAVDCRFPFPMLYDETQEAARAFTAACTPDFFLFDSNRQLAYRGRLDDSTPGNGKPVTGADLRRALDAVVQGQPVPEPHEPSLGCGIKWKM